MIKRTAIISLHPLERRGPTLHSRTHQPPHLTTSRIGCRGRLPLPVFPGCQRTGICTLHGWSFALILALDSAPCLYTRRREHVLAAHHFLRGSHPQPTYKYGFRRCCLTLVSTVAVSLRGTSLLRQPIQLITGYARFILVWSIPPPQTASTPWLQLLSIPYYHNP